MEPGRAGIFTNGAAFLFPDYGGNRDAALYALPEDTQHLRHQVQGPVPQLTGSRFAALHGSDILDFPQNETGQGEQQGGSMGQPARRGPQSQPRTADPVDGGPHSLGQLHSCFRGPRRRRHTDFRRSQGGIFQQPQRLLRGSVGVQQRRPRMQRYVQQQTRRRHSPRPGFPFLLQLRQQRPFQLCRHLPVYIQSRENSAYAGRNQFEGQQGRRRLLQHIQFGRQTGRSDAAGNIFLRQIHRRQTGQLQGQLRLSYDLRRAVHTG